jgi:hypothetical protein
MQGRRKVAKEVSGQDKQRRASLEIGQEGAPASLGQTRLERVEHATLNRGDGDYESPRR